MAGLDQSIVQLNLAHQPSLETSLVFRMGRCADDFTFADDAGNPVPGITCFDVDGVAEPDGTTFDATNGWAI